MTPQDYANLASIYLNELANEQSPGKGKKIIAMLEATLPDASSTLCTYHSEEGFIFYRVSTPDDELRKVK